MKRILLIVVAALVVLAVVLVVRTLRLPAPAPAAEASPAIALDADSAAAHLAAAVRFPTVSYASGAPIDTAAFLGLHRYLEETFPLVHGALTREVVGGLSLLYTWPGADPSLAPVVLMGHMDVVPVPEETLGRWSHAPFAGEIADGFVWGRGTLDDKVTVIAILEAVETLLREGHQPPRTVYLAFGHDEEVSGIYGAKAMVDLLVSRGVKPALVLDEGGAFAENLLPGLPGRAAIVGVAEKGYLSLRLTADAAGGHSSMPPPETAIGILSQAVVNLERDRFPLRLDGPTRTMVETMAPYAPFPRRLVLANLWLTSPLVVRTMSRAPLGAALLGTTTAPTMLDGGIKDNVLPARATAVVNFRIRPGETAATVTEQVRRIIDDERITVAPLDTVGTDPSPVSDVGSPAYGLIEATIREMAPGEALPVVPYLVMGGTDAKYWAEHTDRAFRFLAVPLRDGDLQRIHGTDERVGIQDFAAAVGFFIRLIQNIDKL
ncbi:MAG TPA: M20 family peptidase [Gemmatimonadales bacterium]